MIAPFYALLGVVAFCTWRWRICENQLERVRAERDVLLQMTKQAPDEIDVLIAIAVNEVFGERPWKEGS